VHTVHAGTNRIPMRRLPLLFPAAVFLPGGAGFKSWQTDEWQQNATDEAGCSFRMKSLYRESSAATHTHTHTQMHTHSMCTHLPPPSHSTRTQAMHATQQLWRRAVARAHTQHPSFWRVTKGFVGPSPPFQTVKQVPFFFLPCIFALGSPFCYTRTSQQ